VVLVRSLSGTFVTDPFRPKLDYILADIPFLAVGILGFCTFTFLALTRRLGMYVQFRPPLDRPDHVCSMLTVLHLSIIAAFIASTLDLAQILQRGRLNTDLGLQLNTVQSLLRTREVAYSLSASLRFIFFWIFVAEPPRPERNTASARAGVHSGNWNAWGFIGISLQWATFCLAVTIFVLQVVWRLDNEPNTFTNVYVAEATIEVILSAVFALKLLLNCGHCTIVPKWMCALDYSGFVISLLFSGVFGVASLMRSKSLSASILTAHGNTWRIVDFTETILGRFLQGVNFYILVLFSLLTLFLPQWKSGRIPSFHPLSPKPPTSSFHLAPPDVSTPNLSAVQPQSDSSIIQQPPVDRLSPTARMAGWLANQRRRLSSLSHRGGSQDDMGVQLWNQSRVEHGLSFREPSKNPELFKKVYGYPDPYTGTDPVLPPPVEKPKLEAPRLGRGFVRSAASCYSDLDLSPPEIGDRKSWQPDSPVFGLNGIVRPSTGESGLRSQGSVTVAEPDRSSDISGLFRKQEELDNSIAALKLLEGSAGLPNSPSSSKPSATRSDFSLSNFPTPPWASTPEPGDLGELDRIPTPIRTTKPLRIKPPSISVNSVPFDLIPPRMPASAMEHNRTLSLPVSETEDSDVLVSARTQRFDSQGTQYDVTSFIGSTFFPFLKLSVILPTLLQI
jgi:hypothetical protein